MNKKITQKTIWKLTIVQKVVMLFQELERQDADIAGSTTNDLIFSYYYRNGLSNLARAHELHHKIDIGELPTIESVSRAIRKARQLNPDWIKRDKELLIEKFAEKVGYRDSGSLFKK